MSTLLETEMPESLRWDKESYNSLIEQGALVDKRVELIEGVIVTMPPMFSGGQTAIHLVSNCLQDVFPRTQFSVRVQVGLNIPGKSIPEPDIAVVAGAVREFAKRMPETALLVVEVAELTLRYDRGIKAGLYAKAGIPEYWIVNLIDHVVEVYRSPQPRSGEASGWGYAASFTLQPTDTVTPLAAPNAVISAADLLP